ncbi:MAG: aldo/keto reductase, partial [Candidatus Latescibacteria bacterium]|nr:aldo/keto reductase [Candidatus Latescibacterota bacterium]
MEYQVFGRTGLRVSPVALGTGLWAGRNTVAECLAMMDRAIDVGVNFIDTSNVYSAGASEEAIGEGLKGRRDSVVLATKVRTKVSDDHPNDGGLSRTHIMSQVERSLTRLKTDYIDIY